MNRGSGLTVNIPQCGLLHGQYWFSRLLEAAADRTFTAHADTHTVMNGHTPTLPLSRSLTQPVQKQAKKSDPCGLECCFAFISRIFGASHVFLINAHV